jgi:hypothetical protein
MLPTCWSSKSDPHLGRTTLSADPDLLPVFPQARAAGFAVQDGAVKCNSGMSCTVHSFCEKND